jgi:hypothetical protein
MKDSYVNTMTETEFRKNGLGGGGGNVGTIETEGERESTQHGVLEERG